MASWLKVGQGILRVHHVTWEQRVFSGFGFFGLMLFFWALTHVETQGMYIRRWELLLYILIGVWVVSTVLYKTFLLGGVNVPFLGSVAFLSIIVLFLLKEISLQATLVPAQWPPFYNELAVWSLALSAGADLLGLADARERLVERIVASSQ